MEYYRRYTNVGAHPKSVAAGFWGERVFTALCDISGEFDLGGELPAHYCNPEYLIRRMNLWDGDCPPGGAVQAVCTGMQRARVAGLTVQHEDGSLSIPGWSERQPTMPLNSTERSRKRRRLLEESRMQRDATQRSLPGVAATQERRGEERRTEEPAVLVLGRRVDESSDSAEMLFAYWKQVMGKNARTQFDDKRRRAVEKALQRYTPEDLMRAVDGCKATPFNQGANDNSLVYDDLELICRDARHVERFIGNATRRPSAPVRGRVGAESQDPTEHELTPDELAALRRQNG